MIMHKLREETILLVYAFFYDNLKIINKSIASQIVVK